jgi:hypothetical protein
MRTTAVGQKQTFADHQSKAGRNTLERQPSVISTRSRAAEDFPDFDLQHYRASATVG